MAHEHDFELQLVCEACGERRSLGDGQWLTAAQVEQVREIVLPSGPRPCDCDRCDCGNFDDAQAVAAWDERNGIADLVLSLLDGPTTEQTT